MKALAVRVWEAWDAFWFSPGEALDLAAARVVFAGHALWILLSRDLAATSDLPAVFWTFVPEAARWRYLVFPGHGDLERALTLVCGVALLLALVGLWARASCLVSGLLLYHLAPLETIYWTPGPYERGFTIAVPALITLALAPCADRLSPAAGRAVSPAPGADYRWPLKLIQLYLASVYFIAGWAKLVRVGPDWVRPENLRSWLLVHTQQDQVAVFTAVGTWLADQRVLCLLAAGGALLIDLCFPLAVVSPRAALILVPAALAGHVGILVALNIAFLNVPQLLVFVPWSQVRGRPGGEGPTMRDGAGPVRGSEGGGESLEEVPEGHEPPDGSRRRVPVREEPPRDLFGAPATEERQRR